MDGWMDGWMGGWADEWADAWVGGWADGRTEARRQGGSLTNFPAAGALPSPGAKPAQESMCFLSAS